MFQRTHPSLYRAARALLGLSQLDVAGRSGVSGSTIAHLEAGKEGRRVKMEFELMVRTAYEKLGVDFHDDGERRGVTIAANEDPGGKSGDNDAPPRYGPPD